MASTSAVSTAVPLAHSSQRRVPSSDAFFKPLPIRPPKAVVASTSSGRRVEVKASLLKEKAVPTASMVIPEVAEVAGSGISPSLKNFLLGIMTDGVLLGVIAGAVIGVANFDPVRRN
ncbi:hypothetical protein SLEP1_g34348 [Rubroshorea leprosula]|uniref:Uncharacterized protein n=1 Tax=Rubroshorea leprosula TaxID=152421 RepID=A0AAV5KJS7_9ROSI|nr:hypothetical protein SLEP1_g34348 [Rubroshorea leprosula]